jgi:predicted acetyltransferase
VVRNLQGDAALAGAKATYLIPSRVHIGSRLDVWAPLDVVIEVSDPMFEQDAGRWRLTVDGDKASCTSTQDGADLACTINEISAAYLGGISLTSLASAGRVHERRPDALATASVAFGWHRAPSAIEFF